MAAHPMLDAIGESARPRRAQIRAVIGNSAGQRRRSTEIMTVIRWICREPPIRTPQQLGFVSAMILPRERYGAGVLGKRAFEKRQAAMPERAVDRVYATIPAAAPEIVVKPFDNRARKRRKASACQDFQLEFESTEIVLLVKQRGADPRIETSIKRPKKFARGIGTVGKIEEVS